MARDRQKNRADHSNQESTPCADAFRYEEDMQEVAHRITITKSRAAMQQDILAKKYREAMSIVAREQKYHQHYNRFDLCCCAAFFNVPRRHSARHESNINIEIKPRDHSRPPCRGPVTILVPFGCEKPGDQIVKG